MLEHFTAAQGSNYGMGMGLEDASAQASPSYFTPARDFQARIKVAHCAEVVRLCVAHVPSHVPLVSVFRAQY